MGTGPSIPASPAFGTPEVACRQRFHCDAGEVAARAALKAAGPRQATVDTSRTVVSDLARSETTVLPRIPHAGDTALLHHCGQMVCRETGSRIMGNGRPVTGKTFAVPEMFAEEERKLPVWPSWTLRLHNPWDSSSTCQEHEGSAFAAAHAREQCQTFGGRT